MNLRSGANYFLQIADNDKALGAGFTVRESHPAGMAKRNRKNTSTEEAEGWEGISYTTQKENKQKGCPGGFVIRYVLM